MKANRSRIKISVKVSPAFSKAAGPGQRPGGVQRRSLARRRQEHSEGDIDLEKREVLKEYFGHEGFRQGQEEVVDCLLTGKDALGIMPTGAGKSVCYQVPALMMAGITIVVSPLISLMNDQVSALVQNGVPAAYLNSTLTLGQYNTVLARIEQGRYKIIYVAPERLTAEGFLRVCGRIDISMVAVDEAHCVSQWGQDFRPSYLKITDFIDSLDKRPVVCAFTATATDAVRDDILKLLRLTDPLVVTTGFDRPNLFFSVIRPERRNDTLLELLEARKDKSGIIYCSTRKNVEKVCDLLVAEGYPATRYHAGLSESERQQNQEDFVYDKKPVMVATNAFGMGIDKSNVSYVIHYNMPKNMESYYQEAGRAGRDGEQAECIMLYSVQDIMINRFLINNSEPNPELTPQQQEEIKKADEQRLKYMTFYCSTTDCLRGFILKYFGEDPPESCGKCSNCISSSELTDATVDAQKILSCIARTGQRYGSRIVSYVLRGMDDEKIIQLGFDKLSTFGIMKGEKERYIRELFRCLEAQGYIIKTEGEYPIIKLSPTSHEILRGEKPFMIQKTQNKKKKVVSASSASDVLSTKEDQQLYQALRKLRAEIAERIHMPQYIVFSNAALSEMCRVKPVTDEEFLSISGVGKRKLDFYGKDFMDIIRKYK